MNTNTFELIGRINFIEGGYTKNSVCYVRILLSKKGKNDNYDTYPMMLFGDVAEKAANVLKKGNTGYFKGKINVNKYEDKTTGKIRESLELIAYEFDKVTYDTNEKKYVVENDNKEKAPVLTDEPW